MILDIDDELNRVWNPDVKPILVEAYRCLSVGATRGAIILTWVAVCTDIIEKIRLLAEDGDSSVSTTADLVAQARDEGFGSSSVQKMQEVERSLLENALLLEFVDEVDKRDLARLREDRHLCAHPSMRSIGKTYEPSQELARAHLSMALSILLTHPPSQGKKVLAHFRDYVGSNPFTGNKDHIVDQFFEKVRKSTRRQIIELAAKHTLLQLDAPVQVETGVLADRMAVCLEAFAARDHLLTVEAIRKVIPRFVSISSHIQKLALSRIGHLPAFWLCCPESTVGHLNDLIFTEAPSSESIVIDENTARLLSLCVSSIAREKLPKLVETFERRDLYDRAVVISLRPDAFFLPYLPNMVQAAGSWRSAEHITRNAVIPCAHLLQLRDLEAVLTAWKANSECRTASGMLNLAVELFDATEHIGESRLPVFSKFISEVREIEPEYSGYRYEKLEQRLPRNDGFIS